MTQAGDDLLHVTQVSVYAIVKAMSAGSVCQLATGTLSRDEYMNNCFDNIKQACVMSLCNICY